MPNQSAPPPLRVLVLQWCCTASQFAGQSPTAHQFCLLQCLEKQGGVRSRTLFNKYIECYYLKKTFKKRKRKRKRKNKKHRGHCWVRVLPHPISVLSQGCTFFKKFNPCWWCDVAHITMNPLMLISNRVGCVRARACSLFQSHFLERLSCGRVRVAAHPTGRTAHPLRSSAKRGWWWWRRCCSCRARTRRDWLSWTWSVCTT